MKILVTSDLHVDHRRSRGGAEALAAEIAALGRQRAFDVLLVVGDVATARGDGLEYGLSLLPFDGPRLMTLGNHELWSDAPDTWTLYSEVLPQRIAAAGWHCLDQTPFVYGDVGFVGSVGWYDYSFAPAYLGIPRRFYEAKVSPGAAAHLSAHRHLLESLHDIPASAMDVYARWNDARHIRWSLTDTQFTEHLLRRLEVQLRQVAACRHVVAAVHHLPAAELLPPPSSPAWDFAKAFLGSPRFAELLGTLPNLRHVVCGHSHMPALAVLGGVRYLATGSGYRVKRYAILDVPPQPR
ncbi:MAG: metallophosphoesterase [Tepidisphaerales bacterium]